MNGQEILNEIRILIGDMGYARYNEINRAYREIGRLCHHNWLRGESQEMLTFLDGVSSYWIDLSGTRVLKRIWVKGNDTGKIYWHEMEESPSQTFEKHTIEHIESDGTDREDRPEYYRIVESSNQSIKIEVTPVPDETYETKIEYIKELETISRSTVPSMPESYHDIIADMAAGYILATQERTSADTQRGLFLISKAKNDAINGLVRDSHNNRIRSVSHKGRQYSEFI
jgi:hypothetical protein